MGIDLRDIPQAANALWDIDESDGVKRKAVYTDAFWLAPPYGRPRDIDYERLEPLEKNAWIRMCVQHIVDSIAGAEFNIVPRKKGKEVSEAVLDEARDFFEGDWQEDWKTNLRMMLPDLLHYDCGVTIKAFPLISYDEDGALKDKAVDKTKPVELYSRDGRSFMKDTGLAGRLRQYWQYSWINPQGRPIRFSPDEIMYYQMNPSSRSPYGTANLEVIEFIVDYMIDSAMAQSKYWKNGMFIGGQIDLPEIKELDELKRQQAYYEAKLRGPKKMGKWLVTGGGATIKSIPFTPQQMQWVESQKWFAKIIFGIYRITPSELGFTDEINRATGIQQMEIHKSKAIRPVLTLIEDMMNRQIIWKHFSKDIKFEYVMELSLDDKGKQTDIDVKRLDKGLDSVNELRDRDGLEKWDNEKWDKPTGDEEEQQEEEEDFDWDSYFGGSDEDEDLNVTEEDMKKMFQKGGPGSGPVKGHKRDMPDIKRMDEDYAGMEIQQVRRKLLNYYAPGEIRDMESKNGEKSLRARLQSAVTGKPVSFKKMAEELEKGGPGSGIRGHKTEKRVDFSSPNQKTMEDFMQKEKVPFDEDYTVRIGSDYYRIKTEGWFPDCMESRGYEDTSSQSIREEYLNIMTQESNTHADIHGYMPDYPGTEFGVSYIGVKLNIEKAMTAGAMSGEPGYVPMPEVYDGMGKPIKTKKNEKKIFDLVAAMYKEIQEEVNEEWDRLFEE